MARYITHPAARSFVAGGIVAGTLGGLIFGAFLFAIGLARYPTTYQVIASGILGRTAFTTTNYAWAGIGIHFAIAIVAAIMYAYAAQMSGLLGRPLLGGTIFGLVANGVMDVVVYARGLAALPTTWHDIGIQAVAHVVFFGIPVAWYLSRYERVPVPYS
jgi:hypothetical protein